MLIKNKSQKIRFTLVGAVNTVIDFVIFLSLSLAGVPAIGANYISTTTALSFSFFANKKYTFKSQGRNYVKEITLFVVFTVVGLWVLQPTIIFMVTKSLENISIASWMQLTIAKIAATIVTLVWNYLTYSRFVFKGPTLGDTPKDSSAA